MEIRPGPVDLTLFQQKHMVIDTDVKLHTRVIDTDVKLNKIRKEFQVGQVNCIN